MGRERWYESYATKIKRSFNDSIHPNFVQINKFYAWLEILFWVHPKWKQGVGVLQQTIDSSSMHVLIIPVRKYLWFHVLLSRKLKWSRFWQKYSSFGPEDCWVSDACRPSSFFNSVRALPPTMSFHPAIWTTMAQLKQQKMSRELASADSITILGDNACDQSTTSHAYRLRRGHVVGGLLVWSILVWSVVTPTLHSERAH